MVIKFFKVYYYIYFILIFGINFLFSIEFFLRFWKFFVLELGENFDMDELSCLFGYVFVLFFRIFGN